MAKVLVLYHSSWGHVEALAQEVAAGAGAVAGAVAGASGERQVSEIEKTVARFHGKHAAEIAKKLHG
jgi:NAD(P)H dehydrogenase (quinone)